MLRRAPLRQCYAAGVCFSPIASFTAAAGLAGIGAISVKRARSRELVPFAAVPLLFAVQQATEGVVWWTIERAPFHKTWAPIAQAFLFFALFLWPAYLPVALAWAEQDVGRRRALGGLAVIGALLGSYLFGCAVFRASYACLAFGNLYYGVAYDTSLKMAVPFVYVGIVLAPLLVSSLRGIRWIALLLAGSFALAGTLFRVGFASVWCFFAAVLSGAVALAAAAKNGQVPKTVS